MNFEFEKIAEFLGELCGAAKHDLDTADPAAVGMDGTPVRGWRAAYYEGCTDMASGALSRVPEEHQEAAKAIMQDFYKRSYEEAKTDAAKVETR